TLATSGVTGTPSCTTSATASSPAGSYPITCTVGSLAATNYQFVFVAGTLTITPPPTVAISRTTFGATRMLLVQGTATAGRQVTVTITPRTSGATVQAVNSVVYTTTATNSGMWVVDTATATPTSGRMPAGGYPANTMLDVMATVQGASGSIATEATTTATLRTVFIPLTTK
ncbi:MAG: MBG-2 domain-containing protein, partial [Roseiflexaceae bacterium]|nr:MBG-2 domain-containing protein [Roseiflexaceae bacterium]